ncbi:DUF488 domain-containing protein [Wenzhouxiangella sediminis]|jgi:uncharacterized protein YeaO (DUF488 family)|uniref:DUF488 family protein n=1 Tax=Wenzhouxiangella sediminis TaxID=1792836 RepID=A0A3E1KD33_9GAMM|nr:DUF488 family protein [Wenzhouxiangella sediminis]RFF33027.1 DUF488 family protein [Wenzhouxiangella sediminis]
MSDRIRIQRIYDHDQDTTGTRVLVDRVWPRGVSKDDANLDHWYKELAPSSELRKWFGHDPKLWAAFKQKYRKELKDDDKREQLRELAEMAGSDGLVLLYGAKDTEHNQAVVLREVLEEIL